MRLASRKPATLCLKRRLLDLKQPALLRLNFHHISAMTVRFDFDSLNFPYASRRSVVFAKNGAACAGNPHCASVGLQILMAGGNAVDAAVAMAASQPLFEPTGNGLGADCFAILSFKGQIYGINGSGPAPAAASIEALKALVPTEGDAPLAIPPYGVLPVDVPGAVGAWAALHERFGRLPFEAVLAPAIRYAENGYPVSPNVARWWQVAYGRYEKYADQPAFRGLFETFMKPDKTGKTCKTWYRPGEIFRSPDMAKTLRLIAETKGEAFYRGEIARDIDGFMRKEGGFLRASDLAAYRPEWVTPLHADFCGHEIWELPPNGQGITVLMALRMLEALPSARESVERLHRTIEAVKLALADGAAHVAEPAAMRLQAEALLSADYARERAARIGREAVDAEPGMPASPSTVYFCAADAEGTMVSMIQSNYRGFGSGIVIPGTGISLNDRGQCFSLDPAHPNALAGGKRPYHTIIPGFITKAGEPFGAFGIMGGLMQPQAHVQVLENLLARGLNPQAALDAPRWQWMGGRRVAFEQGFPNHLLLSLERRGHDVSVNPDDDVMGRGQMILRDGAGVLCAATERRTDGQIMAF